MRAMFVVDAMSRGVRYLSVCCLAVGLHAVHAAPALDFGYRIDGPANLRPTLVFNDGQNTYIQPSSNGRLQVAGSTQDGPYLRLPGIPESFVARLGSTSLKVEHVALPSGPSSAGALDVPQIRRAASSTLRVPLAPEAAVLREAAVDDSPTLKAAASAPVGRQSSKFESFPAGPDQRPAVASVGPSSQPAVQGNASAVGEPTKPDSSDASYLAKNFGADGIRDGAAGSIQIRFPSRPSANLQFATENGRHLASSWDDRAGVMTIDASPTFIVRDGRTSVVVKREISDTFHFPAENAAGLEQVFSERGSTYLRLSDGTKKVTVRVDGKIVKGQQKGRFYRIGDTSDAFVVDADGFEVSVTRSRSVRFNDRAGSAS